MARRSAFRLEKLLELRSRREQALAGQLASAEAAARAEHATRDALAALRAQGAGDLLATGRRTVGDLHALHAHVERLDGRLAAQHERIAAAETGVAEAQQRLTVAHQERRVLDRLKEKHVARVRRDEADLDRATMDEVAVARFLRQQGSDL